MKNKKEVTILGYPFKIDYTDDLPNDTLGTTEGYKFLIKVHSSTKGEDRERVLLHEIIHAALHVTGWSSKLGEEDEEGIVVALEHALHKTVKLL